MKSDILKKKFRVGDVVEIISERFNFEDKGKISTIEEVFFDRDCNHYWYYANKEKYNTQALPYEHYELKLKRRKTMNELIIEMFPKTQDAVLIEKHFGCKIDNDPLTRMLIRGKEKELLEEANKLEKKLEK